MDVLISGAANGIGKAVCEYYIQKGINVIALDKQKVEIESNLLKSYQVDITDSLSMYNIHQELLQNGIKLDAIVNIAGMFIIDSFIEVNEEELRRIFEVNFLATVNINKVFFDLLKEKGRIIITSSEVAPLDPMPFNGIYNVTKTALDSYSQALRQELNLLDIKVITIRPGAFNTNLSASSLIKTKELMDKTNLYKNHSKKFYTLVKTFMGKPKDPSLIAKTYYKAITRKKPKLIYKKHTNYLLKLLNILPKGLQCFIIKLLLK